MPKYNPPSPQNWVYVGPFLDYTRECYDEGFQAARDGRSLDDNPHESSGYERDSTYSDEMHFWWYCGHSDFHYDVD